MSKAKFKVGDTVKVNRGFDEGCIGKVIDITRHQSGQSSRSWYRVQFTDDAQERIYSSYELDRYAEEPEPLDKQWEVICNAYLKAFCKKHEYSYEPDMWVGSDPGTIANVCDMFVSMDDIRYDIDHDIPEGIFAEWYWKGIDVYELTGEHYMNYPSYCKGAPDVWTEERMESIRESKKHIQEAKDALRREIENVKHNYKKDNNKPF